MICAEDFDDLKLHTNNSGCAEKKYARKKKGCRGENRKMQYCTRYFPRSADHEQDWQPYPVDPNPCYMCGRAYVHAYTIYDHTYIHTYIHTLLGKCALYYEGDNRPTSANQGTSCTAVERRLILFFVLCWGHV